MSANPTTETDTNLKKIFLIKVEPDANNNKYYNFTELGDGTFKVEYGRVGCLHPAFEIYPMTKWNAKYKEKLSTKKGYVDKTHLFTEEIKKDQGKSTIKEITDKVVNQLVNDLQKFAKVSVETNYIVTSEQVTQKMIDEAQIIVDEITHILNIGQNIEPINKYLIQLFQIIPRKMKHVKDGLYRPVSKEDGLEIKTPEDLQVAQHMIANEQATLDVMAGQVSTQDKIEEKEAKPSAKNILEAMGLVIIECLSTDIPLIKDLMGPNKNQFKRAYQITNLRTQAKFDKVLKDYENKKIELFWHGSRNENWWSILNKGLVLRPANAIINGAMFSKGIYFADKFQKSLGYTSHRGSYWTNGNSDRAFLSIKNVHVGNQFNIYKHEPYCYNLNTKFLKDKGNYDSVFAHGGADLRNNEYIIYTEPQCTIKYLVEVE